MKTWRIPIALKLFLSVLLTTLLLTTVSLIVLQWSLQKNFSRYVTQVEMRKLEHLNNNLAEIYQVYGNWSTAIQSSLNQLPATLLENKARVNKMWLIRQYEIAEQQNDIIKNPALFQARSWQGEDQENLNFEVPSHFSPFKFSPHLKSDSPPPPLEHSSPDFMPPQEAMDNKKGKSRHWFAPAPDRLGVANRLALFDANKQFVTGDQTQGKGMPLQPILVDNHIVGYLGLRSTLDVDDALSINFFSNQQRYILLIYAVSILVSLIVALLLAASFRKPIHRLLNAAQELSYGNYQHHVDVRNNDELGDLSKVINQLAIILDQHEQSRRQWVADTSHELKTPLSVLQVQIEAMQDGVRKATPEHLQRMMDQVMSLKKLTQDLADLAQADAQQLSCYFVEIRPWDIVLNEVENFKPQFEQKALSVQVQGQGIPLISDPDRFKQVIVNLLSNSTRYTEVNGQIHIHTRTTAEDWYLYIDDSPLGVTDEQLQQLGERFYRVDDSRTRSTGGTGLGLALSKKIIQVLGGDLQFSHSPLGGLRCTVRLNRHIQIQKNEKE